MIHFRTILLLLTVTLAVFSANGRPFTTQELISVRDMVLADSISTNALQRINTELPTLDEVPSGDQALLLETYRAVTQAYVRIKYYRQAYMVYERYLEQKERTLAQQFQQTVIASQESIKDRAAHLDEEETATRTEAASLKTSADNYESLRAHYKRLSSLTIILLTFIFAVSLVRTGVRMNNMRREILSVQQRSVSLHHSASLGRLEAGIVHGRTTATKVLLENLSTIKASIRELAMKFKSVKTTEAVQALEQSESNLKRSLGQN